MKKLILIPLFIMSFPIFAQVVINCHITFGNYVIMQRSSDPGLGFTAEASIKGSQFSWSNPRIGVATKEEILQLEMGRKMAKIAGAKKFSKAHYYNLAANIYQKNHAIMSFFNKRSNEISSSLLVDQTIYKCKKGNLNYERRINY